MTYYDDIAEGYEELHREEQLHKIETAKRLIQPKPDEQLLDVGCGTGLTTEPWDCKRYGLDPAKKLIARARQKEAIEYRIETAEENSFADKAFDYVISITAIQNFSDIPKGLVEIKRVLKDEGRALISTLKRGPRCNDIKEEVGDCFDIVDEREDDVDVFWLCRKNL